MRSEGRRILNLVEHKVRRWKRPLECKQATLEAAFVRFGNGFVLKLVTWHFIEHPVGLFRLHLI